MNLGKFIFLLISGCFLFTGCSGVVVVQPKVKNQMTENIILYGPIEYNKNWDYVPRTISNKNDKPTRLSFKYDYKIVYSGTEMEKEVFLLFIPSSAFGSPTGKNDLRVAAKLEIFKDKLPVKTYTSVCGISKPHGLLFGGINYTKLRKKGLLTVKENIELQMKSDKEFLLSLNNHHPIRD